ncbi:MAG TPA: hypothetical protein PLN08_11325, partial [Solirubrobacterales bacterium]|nr:hypothetical protein [Solirubrobacterales bacterium]HNA25077.1 hypothetical protein [Solirubrobacterales bacterium]HNC94131.1 hypothetical protein [Solirubrobacterales bacterium]HNL61841.1 hypothetical protein [Solirubrobacterales bacterium]HNO96890.1 hypothetical protein [Solirubrobacterales bacterium]
MSESLLSGRWSIAIDPARRDGRIVESASEPAAEARLEPLPASLHPGLAEALNRGGIEQLYSHQAEAFE